MAKNTAPRTIAARAPDVLAHAVVVNPRKNSSSPMGARIAAASRFMTRPAASAASGSWLGAGSRNRLSTAPSTSVTTSTGTATSAPSERSRTAAASGRTTPISRQVSAPVPTTSRRITAA